MAVLQFSTVIFAVWLAIASAQEQPLLSTIATIPELSTFSIVLNGSGGNQLNPALEERFNVALDGRNYTGFVPTNDAFARISPDLVRALTAAPAYPILESILRTHVAEGLITSAHVISASPVEVIEGFALTAAIVTGGVILVNAQAQITSADTFASNGVVHQIDQVLNPYTAFFGISNATAPPLTSEEDGSVADIIGADERLTTLRDVLNALQPDFISKRLRLSFTEGTPQIIFAAPSNTAFAASPPGTVESSKAPSNQPTSLLVFSFGLLQGGASRRLADLDFTTGSIPLASALTGFNATVSRVADAVSLNNAVVEAEICVSNGCVWIVDRILDPLYLAFGPPDRV